VNFSKSNRLLWVYYSISAVKLQTWNDNFLSSLYLCGFPLPQPLNAKAEILLFQAKTAQFRFFQKNRGLSDESPIREDTP